MWLSLLTQGGRRRQILVVLALVYVFCCLPLLTKRNFLSSYLQAIARETAVGVSTDDISSNNTSSNHEPPVVVDGLEVGVRSRRDASFFRTLQQQIDDYDNEARCERYGFTYNSTRSKERRIFLGALVADEPWEVFEIVAAEIYGMVSNVVLVESNLTQHFSPRPFRRLGHGPRLAKLFGVSGKVQVRPFVNEDSRLMDLEREAAQRDEIGRGWRDLGMQPEDVGLLSDTDETFSRDFLRAVQVCDGIPFFDYEKHRCRHESLKVIGSTRVFETSPECIAATRVWYHPDMLIGHCITGIGDAQRNPPAPRMPEPQQPSKRALGFGSKCSDWRGEDNITDARYPTWSVSDIRRVCGGRQVQLKTAQNNNKKKNALGSWKLPPDRYTGFHFHNFFANFNSTRFKYRTYGHAKQKANEMTISDLDSDLKMMYRCVKDLPDDDESDPNRKRIRGGLANASPFWPIYFQDPDYRRRRHAYVLDMIQQDERTLNATKTTNS